MNIFYFSLKILIRFSLRIYFRNVKIEGAENVPKNVPLLITPNHQNALMDALVVGAFFPRNIYFLARQDVFNSWSKPILKALKMMPVYRIRDGYSQLKNNDGIFNACFDLFSTNKSVLIFPEGNHGEHHYLRPLTKGAARMALQSEEAMNKSLMILPVGVNYFDHKRARSTVLTVYGKPIPVSDFSEGYQKNPAIALKDLRKIMTEAMQETLVIPEESTNYEKEKAAIFQEKHSHLNLSQLREIKIEEDLGIKPTGKRVIARVLNPFPFWMIERKLRSLKDLVFTSTIKFSIGLITFPLWWTIVFVLFSLFFDIYIGGLIVFTMVVGLFYSYQE